MIRPGSPLAWKLFEVAFRPWLRTRLAGIHLRGLPDADGLDPELPLLLVANHSSWYDGFLLREVHRELRPRGAFHTAMLSRELKGRPILRYLGGVGFEPERPSTFRKVLRILQDDRTAGGAGPPTGSGSAAAPRPAPTLSFFPQGRIHPSFRRPLGFEPGVEFLLRRGRPLHLLCLGIHLEGGNRLRPSAYLSAAPLRTLRLDDALPSTGALQELVEGETDRIHLFLATWGEDAPGQWGAQESSSRPS